jgi:hypothetical protein
MTPLVVRMMTVSDTTARIIITFLQHGLLFTIHLGLASLALAIYMQLGFNLSKGVPDTLESLQY